MVGEVTPSLGPPCLAFVGLTRAANPERGGSSGIVVGEVIMLEGIISWKDIGAVSPGSLGERGMRRSLPSKDSNCIQQELAR
jgi:hypothetical protein